MIASAPPISAKNIGHQMLSKLGYVIYTVDVQLNNVILSLRFCSWSEGQTLGRSGGIAEPVEARVKIGRKGLGANDARKI